MFKFLKGLLEWLALACEFEESINAVAEITQIPINEPLDETPPVYEGPKGVPELWVKVYQNLSPSVIVVYPGDDHEWFSFNESKWVRATLGDARRHLENLSYEFTGYIE